MIDEVVFDTFEEWQKALKSYSSTTFKAYWENDNQRLLFGIRLDGPYSKVWLFLTLDAFKAAPIDIKQLFKYPTRLMRWLAEQMPATEIKHFQSGRLVY